MSLTAHPPKKASNILQSTLCPLLLFGYLHCREGNIFPVTAFPVTTVCAQLLEKATTCERWTESKCLARYAEYQITELNFPKINSFRDCCWLCQCCESCLAVKLRYHYIWNIHQKLKKTGEGEVVWLLNIGREKKFFRYRLPLMMITKLAYWRETTTTIIHVSKLAM